MRANSAGAGTRQEDGIEAGHAVGSPHASPMSAVHPHAAPVAVPPGILCGGGGGEGERGEDEVHERVAHAETSIWMGDAGHTPRVLRPLAPGVAACFHRNPRAAMFRVVPPHSTDPRSAPPEAPQSQNRVRRSSAVVSLLAPVPDAGWRRYAIALIAVAATAGLRFTLSPWIGERLPFVTLFFGVFVAAWYGGLGPALMATGLGVIISSFIVMGALDRVPGMDRIALVGLTLFALTGLATAWLGETRLRAMRRAAAAARQAAAEAERAEDEAAKAEEAAAEAEIAAQEAAESLQRQQEAETALRRSEQELADFFENATIGLNWIAADGTVLRANRAQLDLLGCASSEYIGHSFAEFHENRSLVDDMLRRLADGDVLREVPSRMHCGNGEVRDVMINGSPYMKDGRLVHGRCFVRDVTDQVRAEEAVRSLQRLESVGRLAGGVAHEVNNQMTVVLGATDFILRRSDIPEAARTDVQFIRDAARRSAGITAQLLAFGRRGRAEAPRARPQAQSSGSRRVDHLGDPRDDS